LGEGGRNKGRKGGRKVGGGKRKVKEAKEGSKVKEVK
jgi:hypothetical protein